MLIKTTLEDRQLARKLSDERCSYKKSLGIVGHRVDVNSSNEEICYYGLLAEIIVAKLLGVKVNTELFMGSDEGFDLVWRGKTVQVKYSYYPQGRLITRSQLQLAKNDPLNAEYFFLVRPYLFPENDLAVDVRYCTRLTVERKAHLLELQTGTGLCEVVEADELSELSFIPTDMEG